MANREIKYICIAYCWFDKVNGNTYHSVRITRAKDDVTIVHPITYGYGHHYEQTALETMLKAGWIDTSYKDKLLLWDRENGYPIMYQVFDGLKRECVENGKL